MKWTQIFHVVLVFALSLVATSVSTGLLPGNQQVPRALAPLAAADSEPKSGPQAILLLTASSKPFSTYYAEILKAEGFNSFSISDISSLSSDLIKSFELVLLPEVPVTNDQVKILTDWVQSGGNLIAMRPNKKLARLLGLERTGSNLSNGYIAIDTSQLAGRGLVKQATQFHATADLYRVREASTIATVCYPSGKASHSPAITLHKINGGGQVAAFAFDLAKSVILTRQGNPAWSGEARDGRHPIRSNDLFFGGSSTDPQPDWIDEEKIAIPQADEQQRLLGNLITTMNQSKIPIPHFWYLPWSFPAAIVMTGDDHGHGGTSGRFDSYLAASPFGCSVERWECIRGTSYIYTDVPMTNTEAASYDKAGFEIALHLNTGCADWTAASLEEFFDSQLRIWHQKFSALPPPESMRVHCIAWSDYDTLPRVEQNHGVQLDTSYYYWPAPWVRNRVGFFTGSAIPMRFAAKNGRTIDAYQAPTQMTDESGQSYPFTVDKLLDGATGKDGFYGVFTVNAHTDKNASDVSDAVISSAIQHHVPVVSARQMLQWLKGKDASVIHSLAYKGNTLMFSVAAAPGAKGLVTLVPVSDGWTITAVSCDYHPVTFDLVDIKGIRYARFLTESGGYTITYRPD